MYRLAVDGIDRITVGDVGDYQTRDPERVMTKKVKYCKQCGCLQEVLSAQCCEACTERLKYPERPVPESTEAGPGTTRKINVMKDRYSRGMHLFNPADISLAEGLVNRFPYCEEAEEDPLECFCVNGHSCIVCVQVPDQPTEASNGEQHRESAEEAD